MRKKDLKIYGIGLFLELIIISFCYVQFDELTEVIRHAARYSGRLSAVIFLGAFFLYVRAPNELSVPQSNVRLGLGLFAFLHLIHFGLLAANVSMNEVPLIPVKVAGGALAYMMIILAPFYLHKLSLKFHLIYFYYVTLVMCLTYVARLKGEFEGAEPSLFHYIALSLMLLAAIGFGWLLKKSLSALKY